MVCLNHIYNLFYKILIKNPSLYCEINGNEVSEKKRKTAFVNFIISRTFFKSKNRSTAISSREGKDPLDFFFQEKTVMIFKARGG